MTTHDLNSRAAVEEAMSFAVDTASFLQTMHSRMTLEIRALPGMIVTLKGEINQLRHDNTELAKENQVLKERLESLKNR